jgi:ABC-2 type transport system permease protein
MSQLSTFSTFVLFGRTALRRQINRSLSMKFPSWKKKSTAATAAATETDAPVRSATRHRSDRTSLLRRLAGMWMPLMSLSGMMMLSFSTMFAIPGAVYLAESRTAAVLQVSPDNYKELQCAAAIADKDERAIAVDQAISSAFSSPAAWQSDAGKQLAKERFDDQGLAAFASLPTNSRWSSTLAFLSPEGRVQAVKAIGLYLAILNFAIFGIAFGLMSKHLSGTDSALVWLWQFPVSRRVLFSSKLIEYVFDNPTAPLTAIFYAATVWICGGSFFTGLGVGALLGVSAAVTAAAIRLAAEALMIQHLGRKTRGAIVAGFTTLGGFALLATMMGGNARFLIESLVKAASALPAWCAWNPFTAGLGSNAMLNQNAAWWLSAPASAAIFALFAVLLAVRLTAGGLASAQDSVRDSRSPTPTPRATSRRSRLGIIAWKELLQLRRQPELLGQLLATPITIGFLLYVAGYKSIIDLATHGGTNISVAILVGASYMLMVATAQTLPRELKLLWLLQCQPRPLADVIRSKARVWAVIAIGVSVPFIGSVIAFVPSEAPSILIRVPFLLASLWFLSELVFGMTALSATITNEQTVRFSRNATLLPALVVANTSLAICSQSLWMQLGMLATLILLNAAVRERQLVELPWLSEPVETPPKQVYPMDAILAVVGFQAVQGGISAALVSNTELSASAITTVAYCASAAIVTALCWFWMWRNRLTLPALPQGPALRPICWGLPISCLAGLAVTLCARYWNGDCQLPAYATSDALRHAPYDKWCLLGLWVVAAPLFEEWIIRRMLYRSLRRTWGVGLSVALTAILFATLHPVAGCVALLTLGTMTALAAERTGRLWPSITIHAGYNFMIWSLWATWGCL